MTNVNAVIRHARSAVDFVMNGAVRKIESDYADGDPAAAAAVDALIDNLKAELDDWREHGPVANSAVAPLSEVAPAFTLMATYSMPRFTTREDAIAMAEPHGMKLVSFEKAPHRSNWFAVFEAPGRSAIDGLSADGLFVGLRLLLCTHVTLLRA